MARLLWDMARESQYVPPAYNDQIWYYPNQENPHNMGRGRGRGELVFRGAARGRGAGRGDFAGGRGGRGQ